MNEDAPKTFEPVESAPERPPHELRSSGERDVRTKDARSGRATDSHFGLSPDRRESIRSVLIVLTLAVLALAVFTFLVSVNSVISIWFRSQWAPVARSVAALAVVGLCLWVMVRLVRRDVPLLR